MGEPRHLDPSPRQIYHRPGLLPPCGGGAGPIAKVGLDQTRGSPLSFASGFYEPHGSVIKATLVLPRGKKTSIKALSWPQLD